VLLLVFGTHSRGKAIAACRNPDGHARILLAPLQRFSPPDDCR
jgi:hypothetical protein